MSVCCRRLTLLCSRIKVGEAEKQRPTKRHKTTTASKHSSATGSCSVSLSVSFVGGWGPLEAVCAWGPTVSEASHECGDPPPSSCS